LPGLETAFPKANTTNWCDLTCWLPELDLRLSFLFVFGSGDPPYHLGMCAKSEEDNGPYCNTTSRIPRGVQVLQEKIGKIDVIIFQTVLWDLSFVRHNLNPGPYIENYHTRIRQLRDVSHSSLIALRTSPSGDLHGHSVAFNALVVRRVWQESNSNVSSLFLFDWALSSDRLRNQSLFEKDQHHLLPAGCIEHFHAIVNFTSTIKPR